ncbi:unnamed protein product [Trichobilharzia regenti]|nr:unnamed protein product [Trichobilharzia regenti]
MGIALLLGGNVDVQGRMLDYLMRKKLSGFFTSLAGLTQKCSVLDLDTFERCNKAEGLAVGLSDMEGITNLYDADFTCKIFRFLQLLCEGHNLGKRICHPVIICRHSYFFLSLFDLNVFCCIC